MTLGRIEELFAALSGGELFTKLDIIVAYNQLEVIGEISKLLAWNIHKGIYLLNKLPFQVSVYSFLQNHEKGIKGTLQGIKNVINFTDDIVVRDTNKEEHLKNLEVFRYLSEAGFKINFKKSVFFQLEIKYLGYIINKEGLHKDPEKIADRSTDAQKCNGSEGFYCHGQLL